MFKFKQFSVDQSNCAMKINTDGVLLGALTKSDNPKNILDIGTGTGVIALMLAQRFDTANIDAVEIDEMAAATAAANFSTSTFNKRLTAYAIGFEQYFERYPESRFDLIVSNPPFYINSLHSPQHNKQRAKHADGSFFKDLIRGASGRLKANGSFWLILPPQTADMVKTIAAEAGLYITATINVRSFSDKDADRRIVVLGIEEKQIQDEEFVIYKEQGVYTMQYVDALRDFFTIF